MLEKSICRSKIKKRRIYSEKVGRFYNTFFDTRRGRRAGEAPGVDLEALPAGPRGRRVRSRRREVVLSAFV